MGRICSRPAYTVLAWPGLRITCGPQLLQRGGARLGRRGDRGGGAYQRSVERGQGADGIDDALQLGWLRRGGSVTCVEDGGGESGGGKECSGSRQCLPMGTATRSRSGGGMRLQTVAATRR
jgi:hypothetical protein